MKNELTRPNYKPNSNPVPQPPFNKSNNNEEIFNAESMRAITELRIKEKNDDFKEMIINWIKETAKRGECRLNPVFKKDIYYNTLLDTKIYLERLGFNAKIIRDTSYSEYSYIFSISW